MSQVLIHCPHLALSYTSLSSLQLYLILLWEIEFKGFDNPASSASSPFLLLTHENNSSTPPMLNLVSIISSTGSVTLPLSSPLTPKHSQCFPYTDVYEPVFLPLIFHFPQSFLSAFMVMFSQKSSNLLSLALKRITSNSPSSSADVIN